MPIRILQQDLTQVSCDVIVNPTDERFSGSGGVDLMVHQTAGIRLRMACRRLAPLAEGEVCYTKGYGLRSKYVIHTVGPRWNGGGHNEAALLRGCYTKALELCEQLGAHSIAFPLISSGRFRFPKDQVLRIAQDAISAYLFKTQSELDVTLCVRDRTAYALAEEEGLRAFLSEREPLERMNLPTPGASFTPDEAVAVFDRVQEKNVFPADLGAPECAAQADISFDCAYEIPDAACLEREKTFKERMAAKPAAQAPGKRTKPVSSAAKPRAEYDADMMPLADTRPHESLDEWLKKQDDSFAVTLLKLIDKKGMNDVECYKRSNVSRKTFSKINTQKDYRPSKQTVLAFAVGLQLTLEETETLLRSAGFSLSRSYTADKIVEYFIRSGNYDVFEINAALYQYDQVLLGC